jgi:hypothetical protein
MLADMQTLDYASGKKPRRSGLWLSLAAILCATPILLFVVLDGIVLLAEGGTLAGEFDRVIRPAAVPAIAGFLLALTACLCGAPRLGLVAVGCNGAGIVFCIGRLYLGLF